MECCERRLVWEVGSVEARLLEPRDRPSSTLFLPAAHPAVVHCRKIDDRNQYHKCHYTFLNHHDTAVLCKW
jgi:hypothetical protein